MQPDIPTDAVTSSPHLPDHDRPTPLPIPGPAASLAVVLVRHAERVTDGVDPALSPAGRARARLLARMLGDASVQGVYVTQLRRSRQTGAPTAAAAGVSVTEYEAHSAAALAATITTSHTSGTVLVVAHSNTVDDIGAALGAAGVGELAENEFDRMFILVRRACGTSVLRLRFGALAH